MLTIAIILAVLILIALLRFGVSVEYGEDGITAVATAGPFFIRIFPRKDKPDKVSGEKAKRRAEKKAKKKADKKTRKEEKSRKKKKEEEPEEKKAGGFEYFLVILSSAKTTLGRLRRRLLIKRLTIRFIAGNEDAAKAAMAFGAASAVAGVIVPVLEKNFRIRRRDFRTSADFCAVKPKIYINAAISLAVWEALYIVFALLPILTKRTKKKADISAQTSTGKEGKEYG